MLQDDHTEARKIHLAPGDRFIREVLKPEPGSAFETLEPLEDPSVEADEGDGVPAGVAQRLVALVERVVADEPEVVDIGGIDAGRPEEESAPRDRDADVVHLLGLHLAVAA